MFENAAIIFPGTSSGRLNIGRILDAMLYYQRVEFVVDGRAFGHLWKRLGTDGTLDLLTHPSMDSKITPEIPVIQNENRNGLIAHRPQFMSHAGRDGFRIDNKDTTSKIAFGLKDAEFREVRPKINKIVKKVGDTRYSKIFDKLPVNGDLFLDLISDVETIRLFLRSFAAEKGVHCNEALLGSLAIEVYNTPLGYVISSNIHPSAIVPGHLNDGWQTLLPMVHDYQLDLRFARSRSADLLCGDVNASISSHRLDLSLNRATNSHESLSAFEQFAFAEARPFGKAFEDGSISLKEALEIIDTTAKFRDWLKGLPVDAELITEFHKAVNRETPLDKLPGRTSRFAIFTGGGIALDAIATGGIGTLVGLGLSAFDTFVLDGMIKGWRPSNFVEKVSSSIGQN